jgi:hypothetical protein
MQGHERERDVVQESQPPPENVVATANRLLRCSGYRELRDVDCEYRDGGVVLRGQVSTYYLKQLAQAVLLSSPAVVRVNNLLDVPPGIPRTSLVWR